MQNILLIRSPYELTKQDLVGYGWSQINFSEFTTIEELYNYISSEKFDIGRQRNQIARFYNIKAGDIVIVPINRAILVGIASGQKSYEHGISYGENRVSVNFFKDKNYQPIKIPRSKLKQNLQSRLRIRMSVVSLTEFEDEIRDFIDQLNSNGDVCFDSAFQQKQSEIEASFKEQLLKNICSGNTFLKSGGQGLESLVLELIEIEGYTGKITHKAKYESIADTDIEASRTDTLSSNKVFIQVKNHSGNTSNWGIEQLVAVNEDEHIDKWLISSGNFSELVREHAEKVGVYLMDGSGLVDWIYQKLEFLSPATKEKLGVSFIPQLLI